MLPHGRVRSVTGNTKFYHGIARDRHHVRPVAGVYCAPEDVMADLQAPDRMSQLVWTILAALGALVGIVVLYRIIGG